MTNTNSRSFEQSVPKPEIYSNRNTLWNTLTSYPDGNSMITKTVALTSRPKRHDEERRFLDERSGASPLRSEAFRWIRTPRSTAFLLKLAVAQLVNKFYPLIDANIQYRVHRTPPLFYVSQARFDQARSLTPSTANFWLLFLWFRSFTSAVTVIGAESILNHKLTPYPFGGSTKHDPWRPKLSPVLPYCLIRHKQFHYCPD
jgi:hypothetical protein